jgi:hypothetical protein
VDPNRLPAGRRLAAIVRRRVGAGRPAPEVVDELFRALLLRPADPESLDYYVGALSRGVAFDRVVEAIAGSIEAVENAWRAPVASALGPALLAQADQRQVYAATPPGGSTGAAELVDRQFPADGPRVVLGGFDLDQLHWTPPVIRHRAGLVTGSMGRAGLGLVGADPVSVMVVARPSDISGGDTQARCLLGRTGPGRAWIDFDPQAEARRRGLDDVAPLQALNEAGPEDLDPAALSAAAVDALAGFERVVVLSGSPGSSDGTGPDWDLYRAACARAGQKAQR